MMEDASLSALLEASEMYQMEHGHRRAKYPLRFMAVGEDVFFPGVCGSKISKKYWMYPSMKFKSRTVVRSGVEGCRVWRIA